MKDAVQGAENATFRSMSSAFGAAIFVISAVDAEAETLLVNCQKNGSIGHCNVLTLRERGRYHPATIVRNLRSQGVPAEAIESQERHHGPDQN